MGSSHFRITKNQRPLYIIGAPMKKDVPRVGFPYDFCIN
jgi:hypothetical protein